MAKEYLLGNRARELLIYTTQVTRPVADQRVPIGEITMLLRRLAGMKPDEAAVTTQEAVQRLDKRRGKVGFPKSATFTYIKDLRETALRIVRNVNAANECMFETEHQERLRLIKAVLDDCKLMLELVQISLDLGYSTVKRSKHWTKKISDVRYMCLAWKKKDTARANKLVAGEQLAARRAEMEMISAIIKEVAARE